MIPAIQAVNMTDFYKTDHRRQAPPGVTEAYGNMTARSSRVAGVDHVVNFGLQYFIKRYLMQEYQDSFFGLPKDVAIKRYKRRLDHALGKNAVPMDHVEGLYDLGYLPVRIKALPEGALVPLQVPLFTIQSTHKDFAWFAMFLETVASNTVWGPCTSATTAFEYRKAFEFWANQTGAPRDFVKWQGHDFSMRGMFGMEAAMMSGAAHLLSFTGTDTIPAIDFLETYYNADCEKELIGGSVPATEHGVMCAGGMESEIDTYRRLITEVYPKGVVSVVSDTWDFWKVVTEILPALKKEIMARDGKLVIRPDSGDPVNILIGKSEYPWSTSSKPEDRGLIQCLWDTFGGTVTPQGYRMLDGHIGAIYGDSITRDRQDEILKGLARNKFASSNVVLGIGSYTYQHVTRDTFGFAMKTTNVTVDGEDRAIFKAPKTDSGKNSHKGLLLVLKKDSEYICQQNVSRESEESDNNELQTVFEDGSLIFEHALGGIRARIDSAIERYLGGM